MKKILNLLFPTKPRRMCKTHGCRKEKHNHLDEKCQICRLPMDDHGNL